MLTGKRYRISLWVLVLIGFGLVGIPVLAGATVAAQTSTSMTYDPNLETLPSSQGWVHTGTLPESNYTLDTTTPGDFALIPRNGRRR